MLVQQALFKDEELQNTEQIANVWISNIIL